MAREALKSAGRIIYLLRARRRYARVMFCDVAAKLVDEAAEVLSIRLRKKLLDETDRKREDRAKSAAAETV